MRPTVSAVFLLALLAGCSTMTPEEQRAADEETCRSYGFRARNDAFAECLQRIELDRRAQSRANRIAFETSRPPMVIYQPVLVRPRN